MSIKGKFRFLEHKADAYIEAYGTTLEEAFTSSALATFEVMTETEKVAPVIHEEVEVEGYDEKSLLYNWLEMLIVKFDLTRKFYSEFKIEEIQRLETGLRLKARISGEKFDPKKHSQRVGVKAVTYHQMEISKGPNIVRVRFILDI